MVGTSNESVPEMAIDTGKKKSSRAALGTSSIFCVPSGYDSQFAMERSTMLLIGKPR